MTNYVNGILHLSIWGKVIALLIMTHVTVAATTIYLHRSQAHRALDLHPIISHFFRFWLWLSTGTRTKAWVAVHRKHHAKCETAEDPHSPQVLGLKKVLLEGAELYFKEAANQETLERYGRGCPDDWMERNVYARWQSLGIAIMFAIDILCFGALGITMGAIQMIWIPVFAGGVINGIGHYWGYRNFETAEAARNIVPWSILTAGEELHNNHHAYATSAKLSVKPWEFDLGWLYIRIFQIFGLAKVHRVAPKLKHVRDKDFVDLNTLSALVVNRFQILAEYGREVVLPVLREEKRKADVKTKVIYRRAKSLMIKADEMLDEMSKQRLSEILEKCQSLKTVYQYREKLQSIWNKTSATQKELVEALRQWCQEAEATGIQSLRSFSLALRSIN